MSGKGRSLVLGVHSADPVLSTVAAIGLAAITPACLIVDLAGDLRMPAGRNLGSLLVDGPRLDELSPGRRGVALLAGGGVEMAEAERAIADLTARWPALVVRSDRGSWVGPSVPVVPLYPGLLSPTDERSAVWQPAGSADKPPGPGPVLPRLRPGLTRRLLAGQLPRRSRWMAAWRDVWDMPWA